MKNHRFLWLRNRTTDNRKCEKARNIKEKRTIEMFNTVSKQLVALRSSASADRDFKMPKKPWKLNGFRIFRDNYIRFTTPQDLCSGEFLYKKRNKYDILYLNRSK